MAKPAVIVYDNDTRQDLSDLNKLDLTKSVFTGTDTTTGDTLNVCDSASAMTLTVIDGTYDTEPLIITNRGAGTVTLSGKLSTTTGDTTVYSGETIVFRWDVSDDEWQ